MLKDNSNMTYSGDALGPGVAQSKTWIAPGICSCRHINGNCDMYPGNSSIYALVIEIMLPQPGVITVLEGDDGGLKMAPVPALRTARSRRYTR